MIADCCLAGKRFVIVFLVRGDVLAIIYRSSVAQLFSEEGMFSNVFLILVGGPHERLISTKI